MPWTREEKAAYNRKYRERNKEKIAAHRERNKEEAAVYMKEYRERNKEKIAAQMKEYCEKNKEEISEKKREYDQTPKGKQVQTIANWKSIGLIHDDYHRLYDAYLESTNCEECGVEYGVKGDGTQTFKCMDHDHQNGYFRNFLCCSCNLHRG